MAIFISPKSMIEGRIDLIILQTNFYRYGSMIKFILQILAIGGIRSLNKFVLEKQNPVLKIISLHGLLHLLLLR